MNHILQHDSALSVNWLRSAIPYLDTHKDHTFVIQLCYHENNIQALEATLYDIVLLQSLDVQIVLVIDVGTHIENQSDALTITQLLAEIDVVQRKITQRVTTAARKTSPLKGRLTAVSGVYVIAQSSDSYRQPDHQKSIDDIKGWVRKVDVAALKTQLSLRNIVILPCYGFSSIGDILLLDSFELAQNIAIGLKAEKWIVMDDEALLTDNEEQRLSHLSVKKAKKHLAQLQDNSTLAGKFLKCGVAACENGVKRMHLLDMNLDGALFLELFSTDGIGTMINADIYDDIRVAKYTDTTAIRDLTEPLIQSGILLQRTAETIAQNICDFLVMERDGVIVGCVACHHYADDNAVELACLAIGNQNRNLGRGDALYAAVEQRAHKLGAKFMFALTTHTLDWFLERGFKPARLDDLPAKKINSYDHDRSSKIVIKPLVTRS